MTEEELRTRMAAQMRQVIGAGCVDWYYQDLAEPFVRAALHYAENRLPSEKATAVELPYEL